MSNLPYKQDNPKGLHQKYFIQKVKGWKSKKGFFGIEEYPILEPCDSDAEYFVLRLDKHGSDPIHIEACRKAVLTYANEIKDHIPKLSEDLIKRYSQPNNG